MNQQHDTPRARIDITSTPASTYQDSDFGRLIRATPRSIFEPGDPVFTIGSSFAHRVRAELADHGHAVTPDIAALDLDPSCQRAGQLGLVNYYTVATIRQEIERSLAAPAVEPVFAEIAPGQWPVQPRPDGIGASFEPWEARFQDPRRHGVVARSERDIVDLMAKIDASVRDGLTTARAFIVTVSLTENWIDPEAGHCLWSRRAANVSTDPDRFEFRQSSYEDNRDDLAWVCETIADRFPGRPIVLTVSPVIPPRTFTTDDVVLANTYGKAVLRAVAGEMAATFDHVTYWPSFEFSMAANDWREDGRHIAPDTERHDVVQFVAASRADTPVSGVEA